MMRRFFSGVAVLLVAMPLCAQNAPVVTPDQASSISAPTPTAASTVAPSHAVDVLTGFRQAEVKFKVAELMRILRDREHEGWVLAAYPDPKTGHPLIGAGVSLDLPERPHPQADPMNAHDFIEPSSAELWQAAGIDAHKLDAILAEYDQRLTAWSKKGFRRKIGALAPQITDDEADQLLRVSVIQAIYNAKGYCRDFDKLTAPQQMAMAQLVYQMGVNLGEFSQFLALINHDAIPPVAAISASSPMQRAAFTPVVPDANQPEPTPLMRTSFASDADYWKAVQLSLVQSQWARLYRMRAVAVIAMLDPAYGVAPNAAERRVALLLHPAVVHRRTARGGAARRVSGGSRNRGNAPRTQARRTKRIVRPASDRVRHWPRLPSFSRAAVP